MLSLKATHGMPKLLIRIVASVLTLSLMTPTGICSPQELCGNSAPTVVASGLFAESALNFSTNFFTHPAFIARSLKRSFIELFHGVSRPGNGPRRVRQAGRLRLGLASAVAAVAFIAGVGGYFVTSRHASERQHSTSSSKITTNVPAERTPADVLLESQIRDLINKLAGTDSHSAEKSLLAMGRNHTALTEGLLIQTIRSEPPEFPPGAGFRTGRAAATILGHIGDASAVEPLLELLQNKNLSNSVSNAISALTDIGRRDMAVTVPPLRRLLRNVDTPPYTLARVAEVLGNIGDTDAVPDLLTKLNNPDHDARYEVAIALGRIGDRRAVGPLLDIFNRNPDGVEGYNALSGLVLLLKQSNPAQLESLAIKALRSNESAQRMEAANALRDIATFASVPALISALHDSEDSVHANAAIALGRTHDNRAVEPLGQAMEDSGDQVAPNAFDSLVALSRSNLPAVENLLVRLLGSSGAKRKITAIRLASEIGSRRSVAALITNLSHPDSDVRREAIQALGRIGDPNAVQPLLNALRTGDGAQQFPVIKALALIGDRRAIPALLKVAERDPSIHPLWPDILAHFEVRDLQNRLHIRIVEDENAYLRAKEISLLRQILDSLPPGYRSLLKVIAVRADSPAASLGGEVGEKDAAVGRLFMVSRNTSINALPSTSFATPGMSASTRSPRTFARTVVHEMEHIHHANSPANTKQEWSDLHEESEQDEDNFARHYGFRDEYEDSATVADSWFADSRALLDRAIYWARHGKPILLQKTLRAAALFRDGDRLRMYRLIQTSTGGLQIRMEEVPFKADATGQITSIKGYGSIQTAQAAPPFAIATSIKGAPIAAAADGRVLVVGNQVFDTSDPLRVKPTVTFQGGPSGSATPNATLLPAGRNVVARVFEGTQGNRVDIYSSTSGQFIRRVNVPNGAQGIHVSPQYIVWQERTKNPTAETVLVFTNWEGTVQERLRIPYKSSIGEALPRAYFYTEERAAILVRETPGNAQRLIIVDLASRRISENIQLSRVSDASEDVFYSVILANDNRTAYLGAYKKETNDLGRNDLLAIELPTAKLLYRHYFRDKAEGTRPNFFAPEAVASDTVRHLTLIDYPGGVYVVDERTGVPVDMIMAQDFVRSFLVMGNQLFYTLNNHENVYRLNLAQEFPSTAENDQAPREREERVQSPSLDFHGAPST